MRNNSYSVKQRCIKRVKSNASDTLGPTRTILKQRSPHLGLIGSTKTSHFSFIPASVATMSEWELVISIA